jgi:hypothetical protein
MSQVHFGFLLAAGIALAVTTMVSAGPVAGIVRTDGQPLEPGPFDSHSTSAGQAIGHQFQSMYLASQSNLWTKTFRWEIAGNTGLAPGQTLSIMESIPLIYPDNSAGTDGLVKLPVSGWHESIVNGDLGDFFQWDSQSRTTSITARIDAAEIPIDAHVSFSSDGKSVWFDFDAIQIPTQGGTSDTPVTLDILKQVQWIGPVLDPIPTSHYIDILVSEFPTTPALAGDYNADGFVDAADYVVWRKGLSTTYIPSDYNAWRANFGQSAGSGSGVRSNARVPEPKTLLQLILALFWMLGGPNGAVARLAMKRTTLQSKMKKLGISCPS